MPFGAIFLANRIGAASASVLVVNSIVIDQARLG